MVFAMFIATVLNILLKKFDMPTIIGYIITWTIVSYVFWLVWEENHTLKNIAEFGVVFLMFTIWLEFSIKNLIKMRKNVFLLWWLQFSITSFIFFLICYFWFWLDIKESIIISVWLSLSSTAIILTILNQNWDINKVFWNKSLWILLFQDLMVVPILLLITILSTKWVSIPVLIWKTAITWAILFIVLFLLGKYVLNYFLEKVSETKSNEIFISSILFILIWSSFFAHYLGFSYSLWALIAWVLIAETHYKHKVEADLIAFRDLLLWLFFITVGMQLNMQIIYENISIILIILALFLAIKIIIIYAIVIFEKDKKAALKTALTLFAFWEFAIVIFQLAAEKALMSHNHSQILIIIIIISMIITPFILKNITPISFAILRDKGRRPTIIISEHERDHIILIWYGRLGEIISDILDKIGEDYIILENYVKAFNKGKREWKDIIFGSAKEETILKHLHIKEARAVLISVWHSDKIFLIVEAIKNTWFTWKIIVKVNNFEEENKLLDIGISDIIVETEKTALSMIKKIR